MRNNVFLNYIYINKISFLILVTIFIIGIFSGTIFTNNIGNDQKKLIQENVNNIISQIKNDENFDKISLLKQSLKKNLFTIFVIWILGCSIYGNFLIFLIILYKGFSVGYTFSAYIMCLGLKKGIMFNLIGLTFQNILFVLDLLFLAQSGIKIFRNLKNKNFMNLKYEMNKYTIKTTFSTVVACMASVIEIYISTNLLYFFKEIF